MFLNVPVNVRFGKWRKLLISKECSECSVKLVRRGSSFRLIVEKAGEFSGTKDAEKMLEIKVNKI